MNSDEDFDWEPPSEAERKMQLARRERNDKISKLMAAYLLKGYKMLATNCSVCQTIEMEDRQGKLYCLACNEIDCQETSKDNPVLNPQAAETQLRERVEEELVEAVDVRQLRSEPTNFMHVPTVEPTLAASSSTSGRGGRAGTTAPTLADGVSVPAAAAPTAAALSVLDTKILNSLEVVSDKMKEASAALKNLPESGQVNLTVRTDYVKFIKECADAVTALKQAAK